MQEKLYEIYLITNLINNKKYVGQTKLGYLNRFKSHIKMSFDKKDCQYNNRLHSAMRHYGEDNFKVELLENNIPKSLVDERETYYINKYDTFYKNNKGYNMTMGGQGVHNYSHTNETREKLKVTSKKFWNDLKANLQEYNEFIERRRQHQIGLKFSDEHKRKLSEIAKTRIGEKNPFYNKHHTDETRKKLSEMHTKQVGMYDLDDNLIMIFKSLTLANEWLIEQGKTNNRGAITRISKICKGIDKTAYGYKWKFL